MEEMSDRSWIATLLLAIFLPVHRFYVGKIGTGILPGLPLEVSEFGI